MKIVKPTVFTLKMFSIKIPLPALFTKITEIFLGRNTILAKMITP